MFIKQRVFIIKQIIKRCGLHFTSYCDINVTTCQVIASYAYITITTPITRYMHYILTPVTMHSSHHSFYNSTSYI